MKKKNVGSLVLGVLCGLFGLIGALSMSETKPVNAEAQSLINKDTVWRYLDDNTDPAVGLDSLTAWTLPNFDDSAWKQGSGSFGAKNGAIANVNGKTPQPNWLRCSSFHFVFVMALAIAIVTWAQRWAAMASKVG